MFSSELRFNFLTVCDSYYPFNDIKTDIMSNEVNFTGLYSKRKCGSVTFEYKTIIRWYSESRTIYRSYGKGNINKKW